MTETRAKPLHGIFTAVPPHYDLVNSIITWGMDKHWRKLAAKECSNSRKMLDLGCGTGDLSVSVAKLSKGETEITGLDYSEPMLEMAREKVRKAGASVTFVNGDAAKLPFPDGFFDCVGISFAFRNLTYRNPITQKALSEVLRVLKPGGRFVAVESSQPTPKFVRFFFHLYLRVFVANVGFLVSGNRGAYKYLAESAVHFYMPDEIKQLLLKAGFKTIRYKPLFLGAAGIHVAMK
jgi:demethylmenaquinone methyltransferase / 2-methoxy-6-polyprenyl-1,4-benzoquinol methylase